MSMKTVTWNEFEMIDLRVGNVVEVEDFPEAHNLAGKLTVDFGPEIGIADPAPALPNFTQRRTCSGSKLSAW